MRGLGSSSKSRKIIQELNYSNCDIILLQETHVSCKKQAEEFEILWRGKCLWSFGTGRSAGVAILFSLNFPGKIIRFLTDSEGRILSLLIDYYNCQRASRAKTRGWRGGSIIEPCESIVQAEKISSDCKMSVR